MKNVDTSASKLTLKQEHACQAYIVNSGNKSEAYRAAYNAENMSMEAVNVEACRLFKNPNVALRVLELQESHRERHNVTVDSITTELNEAKDLANKEKQPAAMTTAIMSKAKLHGLLTDKYEHTGGFNITLSSKDADTL